MLKNKSSKLTSRNPNFLFCLVKPRNIFTDLALTDIALMNPTFSHRSEMNILSLFTWSTLSKSNFRGRVFINFVVCFLRVPYCVWHLCLCSIIQFYNWVNSRITQFLGTRIFLFPLLIASVALICPDVLPFWQCLRSSDLANGYIPINIKCLVDVSMIDLMNVS